MVNLQALAQKTARTMFDLFKYVNATYTGFSGGTYDPQTDTYTGQTTNTFTVKALLAQGIQKNIQNLTVLLEQAPQIVVLKESTPPGFSPRPDDTILFEGTLYVVVSFIEGAVGPLTIAYIMTVKN